MMVPRFRLAATALAGMIVIGCAGTASTAPPSASGAEPPPTRQPSAPAPSPSPSIPPTPATEPPTPPTIEPSEAPHAASSSPSEMSLLEQDLEFGLRGDARIDCMPRRSDLPPQAMAGVECHVSSDLVDRVGIYAFASQEHAFRAYLDRLTSVGVALRTGDCHGGTGGDSAWTPGDGLDGVDILHRSGCYLDENGKANIRMTCWGGDQGGVYIGVLGATGDIAALEEWVWRIEAGTEGYTPSSPRICNDQGAGPGPDPDFP